jgi:FkbM family methyltransferase
VIRSAVRPWFVHHPRVTSAVATVAKRVGATGAAGALERAADDMARAAIPEAVVGRRGVSLVMVTRNGSDMVARIMRDDGWDAFERPMPAVFAACVRAREGHVLDVGANTGFYSILAAHTRPGSPVTAFEPFPPVIEHLRTNLRLNGVRRQVTVVGQAVGSKVGTTTLYVPLQDHGLVETSCTMNPEFKDSYSASFDVPLTTIDHALAGSALGPVSVVKIDVESLEHEVLAGAMATLERDRPYVFVEVLPVGDQEAIEAVRRSLGYLDVRLHPDQASMGDRIEFVPDAWNHLLVPESAADDVAKLLHDVGLPVA